MNKEELYKRAIDKWGIESQINMAKEECAELIVALCKISRVANGCDIYALAEEIADVEIMIEQVKYIFKYRDEGRFNQVIELHKLGKIKKLERLLEE